MDKKKILVTGGSGFIGSHIVEALVKTDKYQVYAVDDHSGGSPANVPSGCFFNTLDLRDKEKTKNYINRIQPDIIYMLAAEAREGCSFFSPISSMEKNVNVFMNIIEPAIANDVKKIIYFSSMAVYGNQVAPFNEDMKREPCDVYGAGKRYCEETLEMLSKAHDFKYTIIRPRNVYGERQCLSDLYRNVVSIFQTRIRKCEPIYVYGQGEQRRSFSYIDFSVPCYLKCLEEFTNGQIYNIGGMKDISINELADIVIDCYPEYKKPEIIHLADRHDEVKYAWATYDKAVNELGYKEEFDVKEGVRRMSEWVKLQELEDWTEERLPLINNKVPITWTIDRNKHVKKGDEL